MRSARPCLQTTTISNWEPYWHVEPVKMGCHTEHTGRTFGSMIAIMEG